ncbi:hypothetical protein [Arthrobacter oryzae]|uniref:hypothetical protein n=1 Tax=Arthrobacter oryzae TaxID=409290 RepID=UPI0030CA117A
MAEVHYLPALEGQDLFSLEMELRQGSTKNYYKWDSREGGPKGAYALRCPSCRRDVRLNLERLRAITIGAVAAGLDALDVSNF